MNLHSVIDETYFKQIYTLYWEECFTSASIILQSRHDAADVVQEVFLSLWNKRNEINIQESARAYLKSATRNKCINLIEKKTTFKNHLSLLNETELTLCSTQEDIELKELKIRFQSAVSSLPNKMKEVYILSRYGHLSHKEISDKLEISVGTVKKQIQIALQRLNNFF